MVEHPTHASSKAASNTVQAVPLVPWVVAIGGMLSPGHRLLANLMRLQGTHVFLQQGAELGGLFLAGQPKGAGVKSGGWIIQVSFRASRYSHKPRKQHRALPAINALMHYYFLERVIQMWRLLIVSHSDCPIHLPHPS